MRAGSDEHDGGAEFAHGEDENVDPGRERDGNAGVDLVQGARRANSARGVLQELVLLTFGERHRALAEACLGVHGVTVFFGASKLQCDCSGLDLFDLLPPVRIDDDPPAAAPPV